jgi:hypothetical protein
MDLFSTAHLSGVVNSLFNLAPSFLLDRFFPTVQAETSEEIHFDVETAFEGLAPFVSPVVEGKIMTNLGFTTKTFKPAYIKPKNVFEPGAALKRAIGETLLGSYSPQQRMQMLVAQNLANHVQMIRRRLEWMASSILRLGSVTITGDLYPTTVVSFGRTAGLTVTLSGGTLWTAAGVNPLTDLKTWAALILAASGSAVTDVVMDIGAWTVFSENAFVLARLALQRTLNQAPSLSHNAVVQRGGVLMGTIDGFNIWVYSGRYKSDAGVVTPVLPNGTVLMAGDVGGVQAYGAIQDEQAGIQALPYFSKSWLVEDPGRRFLMTQSAPLLVPYRPDATLAATVLA